MLQQAVYDLMTATPHEPDGARYTPADFALYRAGYDYALVIALRTLQAAELRFELRERTTRLEAKRRRGM